MAQMKGSPENPSRLIIQKRQIVLAVKGTNARPDLPLAVVVGAGGMGMAIARRLGQTHRLLIADRDGIHLDKQSAELRRDGYDVLTCLCDVTNAEQVAALAQAASAAGPIRTLVHVVGLSPSMGDFRTLIAVNLIGATLVADAFLPVVKQGTAAIFISSMAAHMRTFKDFEPLLDAPLQPNFMELLEAELNEPATSTLAYSLSKSTLNRMVKRRARDWGKKGARIVSLSPGLIATPMGALEFERQPLKYDLLKATPLAREGTLLEIADAVEFLASDKASFISGIDLLVDGGLTSTFV
jgi:NAD(P)-dependent dehydrogenase (short-subunit alcohol dehydrogenase family)